MKYSSSQLRLWCEHGADGMILLKAIINVGTLGAYLLHFHGRLWPSLILLGKLFSYMLYS